MRVYETGEPEIVAARSFVTILDDGGVNRLECGVQAIVKGDEIGVVHVALEQSHGDGDDPDLGGDGLVDLVLHLDPDEAEALAEALCESAQLVRSGEFKRDLAQQMEDENKEEE
jgi:hypothetical protein